MKRYCISDIAYEKTSTSKMNLRIHPQTLMEFAKNVNFMNDIQQKDEPDRDRMVALLSSLNSQTDESFNEIDDENKVKSDFFSECNEDIMNLYNVDSIASSEEDMYETILLDILKMPVVYLDISLHIYYTILYQKTEGKFTNLLQDNWTKEEKENFRSQRKSWRAYKKKAKGLYMPFDIDENTLKFEAYDHPQKCIQIQDFAPNLIRLYYANSELRNIFTDTQSANTRKYYSEYISSVYQSSYIHVDRVEEIWLLERILGINLARELYSLLSPIMPLNFSLIEKEFQQPIIDIVHQIIKLQGVYSRCVLVHKLKEIVKIRRYGHKTEQLEPLKIMNYLKQILEECMNSISEEFDYREYNEYQNIKKEVNEKGLDSLKNYCNELLDEYFYVDKEYYILNKNESSIENKKLYSLIQKAIINKLKI